MSRIGIEITSNLLLENTVNLSRNPLVGPDCPFEVLEWLSKQKTGLEPQNFRRAITICIPKNNIYFTFYLFKGGMIFKELLYNLK